MALVEEPNFPPRKAKEGARLALSTLVILFSSFSIPALADDPNFSGKWHLNETRSDFFQLPQPLAHILEVKHEGTSVRCQATVKGDGKPYDCSFTTDGKETRLTGQITRKTITKWEGSALLLNIVIITPDSQRIEMDRWKLLRDGKTLVVRRQLAGPRGEREGTLQYDLRD